MKESKIYNFFLKSIQNKYIDFIQYSFRPDPSHIGGVSIEKSKLKSYFPNQIPGFTNIEQALSLEPVKLSYVISEGVKLVYELSDNSNLDWIHHAKTIKVGLNYKGVTFKLYEFAFGYSENKAAPRDLETYKESEENNEILFYLGAFKGVQKELSKIDFKTNFIYDEEVFIEDSSIVYHELRAEPCDILDLFIKKETLYVNHMFKRVMNFDDIEGFRIDASNAKFSNINFYIPYLLDKFFLLPKNINKVEVLFEDYDSQISFFNENKNLLFNSESFDLESKVYQSIKEHQLKKLASKYCVITYEDGLKKGVVLSNLMVFKLLKDNINKSDKISVGTDKDSVKYQPSEFINKIKVTEIDSQTMSLLLLAQGKKVGNVEWYQDKLEGAAFSIRN